MFDKLAQNAISTLNKDVQERINQLDDGAKELLGIALSAMTGIVERETSAAREELAAWRDWVDSRRVQVHSMVTVELVPKVVGPEPPAG